MVPSFVRYGAPDNLGVTAHAVAPFSFDCEQNVKLTRKMGEHIVMGLEIT